MEIRWCLERVVPLWPKEILDGCDSGLVLREPVDRLLALGQQEVSPLLCGQMRPLGLKILQHQSSSCLGRLGLAPAEDKCDTTIGVVVDEVLLMIVGHELHGEALGIGEVLVDRRNHVSNETDDHRVGDVVKGLMIVVLEGRLVSITAENIDTIVDAQLKELHECRLGCT